MRERRNRRNAIIVSDNAELLQPELYQQIRYLT